MSAEVGEGVTGRATPAPPHPLPLPVVDNHCHLDMGRDGEPPPDLGRTLAQAAAVGVDRVVQIGCELEAAEWTARVVDEHPGLLGGVALHPNEAPALAERGETDLGEAVRHVVVDRGEMTLYVAREHLPAVVRALRDAPALRFELCTGLNGVHFPDQTGHELHAVYNFASITHGGRRIRVEVTCPDSDPHIPSIVEIYPAATWHERETWDMFGIIFDDHPALTRILMPDDWPGHPQRKDYPLGGIPVEYKGATVPPPDQRRAYN